MPTHILRYNTLGEKRYFLGDFHALYGLIGINGNIVSHAPAGIAAFAATTAKPFYIDPQTHAFQHSTENLKRDVRTKEEKENNDPRRLEFKPSIVKLAKNHLGDPFTRVVDDDRPITLQDFHDDSGEINRALVANVSERVIQFQREILFESIKDDDKEFLDPTSGLSPAFYLSPYFFLEISELMQGWIQLMEALYNASKVSANDVPVYFPLVISRELLDIESSKQLLYVIEKLSPDGICLWVDDFSEENAYQKDLHNYVSFLQNIRKYTKNIYIAHAGYFSVLLSHPEVGLIDGIGHSINYGEHRTVVPVGGGIPMARFYLPALHARLRHGDALALIRKMGWLKDKDSYRNVCQCKGCSDLIDEYKGNVDDAFALYGKSTPTTFLRNGTYISLLLPTAEARGAASRHYLYNKAIEIEHLSSPIADLAANISSTYDKLKAIVSSEDVSHLWRWLQSRDKAIEDSKSLPEAQSSD